MIGTKKDLESKCIELEIPVSPDDKGKITKNSFIDALQSFYKKRKYGDSVPKGLEFILSMRSPMLCKRLLELPQKTQDEILDSDEWVAEEKIDGVRMVVCCFGGHLSFFSRNLSSEDYLPIDYSGQVVGDIGFDSSSDFVLDSELICRNLEDVRKSVGNELESQIDGEHYTSLTMVTAILGMLPETSRSFQKRHGVELELKIFDCLYADGHTWFSEDVDRRRQKAREIVESVSTSFPISMSMPRTNIEVGFDKRTFFKKIVLSGGEGIVLKKRKSTYCTTGSRLVGGWLKMKRTTSLMYGDTIDAFITGFVPSSDDKKWADYIGGVEFSINLSCIDGTERTHVLAVVSSLTENERKEMTEIVDGKPRLKQQYYGKVAEIDGQTITAVEKRLRHAAIVRWRDDRSSQDCVLEERFLESQIL